MKLNEKWQYANEIFYPETITEYNFLDGLNEVEYLKYSGFESFTRYINTPIREIISEQRKYTYHEDGNMEKEIIFSIYPEDMIDGLPLLNSYGQIVFNSYMSKYKKPLSIQPQEINYSIL